MKKPNQKQQAWIDARKRHHLSHAQVQMARELGMNPAKLGKIDNHKQEPWKLPLPQFIEELYFKSRWRSRVLPGGARAREGMETLPGFPSQRFGKTAPDAVMSIEERARLNQQKKEAHRAAKPQRVAETT
jgi:hypothetical protein